MENQLFYAVAGGIVLLLFLILKLKIHAFISLLISSIAVGLFAGLAPAVILQTIQDGMAGTLGFVATVVGLGAILGGILEHSGGAQSIASYLVKKLGIKNAPIAMVLSGFFIAIPVFFDVAFIILAPMIYALQRKTGKSLLLYAIPLLAGLAITHAFIPPTPGPIAVADIIGAPLGMVIAVGFCVGIPTAAISGLVFGSFISKKIKVAAPEGVTDKTEIVTLPNVFTVFALVALPIVLIVLKTGLDSGFILIQNNVLQQCISLLGHPFTALLLANVMAWYILGIRSNYPKDKLLKIASNSLAPAGTIILLTGAGGVFKQMLTNTGAGELLASSLQDVGLPIIAFAFITAAIVRVIQGSSTVAMITAAGLVFPLLGSSSDYMLACIVISIASGASIFSHVNDSGFWLVSQYLGLSEKQTLRSWSVMTTILALSGFTFVIILSLFA